MRERHDLDLYALGRRSEQWALLEKERGRCAPWAEAAAWSPGSLGARRRPSGWWTRRKARYAREEGDDGRRTDWPVLSYRGLVI